MRPLIAITPNFKDGLVSVDYSYVKAIEEVGGTPFILPITKEKENIVKLIEICNGLLMTGGGDIAPKYYGEELHPKADEPCPIRDEFDFFCFKTAYALKKPIFAICRGIQLVNVALGGTLYQDLPSQFESSVSHRQTQAKFEPSHSVSVEIGTPLYSLIGERKMVANSFHHQAIKRLADELESMAVANDGVIEAVYSKGEGYLRGYQWHPERLCGYDEDNRKLFEEFVKTCKAIACKG